MERGDFEEARMQLQKVVKYQIKPSPGILLLLAECSVMIDDYKPAYENFVTGVINTNVSIADLMNWHDRILPTTFDVGGLLRMCGAVMLEYAILKRCVVKSSETQHCVDALRHFLLSLEEMVHQLLFNAGTHKSNLSGFILYVASQAHNDLKERNDESFVIAALRDCIVARAHYMAGDFARSWEVTENAIQAISKCDAQTTKYNAYGRLLCWKANLYLLKGNVDEAIPVLQSSIAALEVATDYRGHDEQSRQLKKAVKCLEAAIACQKLRE